MCTDADIIATQLNRAWNPITSRYTWQQVSGMNLDIPGGATIVVIAHGNSTEIGNAQAGVVDVNPQKFLELIRGNMAQGAAPAAIYISSCGRTIAEFTGAVGLEAERSQLWPETPFYGHSDPVTGDVPPRTALSWRPIYHGARRRGGG
jgi:hypothetical protein